MDFNKIFDTYTENIDANKRSNTISEAQDLAGNIGYEIQNLMDNEDVSAQSNDTNTENNDLQDSSVVDAFSELDHIDGFDSLDEEPSLEHDEIDLSEINTDSVLPDEEILPNYNEFDSADTNKILPDNDDTSYEDLDLDNFIGTLDDESSDNNHFDDDIVLNDEINEFGDQHTDDNEFSIENPDELISESTEASIEDDTSNSSDIEIVPDTKFDAIDDVDTSSLSVEDLPPTNYENIEEGFQFNSWENRDAARNVSSLSLTEEQTFLVRNKINEIKNKNLRIALRNIILDPASYAKHFDQLVSLLIIDSSEDLITEFVKNRMPEVLLSEQEDKYKEDQKSKPTFFADDVATYQENLYNIQLDIVKSLKSITFYGVITVLSAIIFWVGIAQPMQIDSLLKKGFVAIQQNEYTQGESYYQQALEISKKPIPEWSIKYAQLYTEKKMVRMAKEKYVEALTFDPSLIDVAKHASKFYTDLGIEYYPTAIKVMDTLSLYHPKKFDVWDDLGSLYVEYAEKNSDPKAQTNFYHKALDTYLTFIDKNPKNIAPYYKIVDIYITLGNKEQIDRINLLIQESKFKFLNIDILNKLIKYYIDHRELDQSSKLLKKITPVLDEYSEKIPKLQQIMYKNFNTDPNNVPNILGESYYQYARYKMLSSDNRSAAHFLTNSIYFNDTNAKSYNLLGEVFLTSPHEVNRLAKAKELFEKSLRINPSEFKPHINIGHLYYYWDSELGDVEQALNTALYHYKLALALAPEFYKNYLLSYNTGWLEYKNKNNAEAINNWSQIYKENPRDPMLSYALGSALFKNGNPKLAQIELTKSATSLQVLRDKIPVPNINNRRHREIYNQLIKLHNNIGVINANYANANPERRNYFETQALLNFYTSKDIADQLNKIYSIAEYNLGVITRPNIRNRSTEFDDDIPKQTTLENTQTEFREFILSDI